MLPLLVASDLPNVQAVFLRRLIHNANPLRVRPKRRRWTGTPLRGVPSKYAGRGRVGFARRHLHIRELLAQLGTIGMDADGRFVAQRQHERSLALHLTEKERLP